MDYDSKTRLSVSNLSSRTRPQDLERIFSRYGRVSDVDMKGGDRTAFVKFSGPRSADDARYNLDKTHVHGQRITVEFTEVRCGERGHNRRNCNNCSKKQRRYHSGWSSSDFSSDSSSSSSPSRSPYRGRSPSRSVERSHRNRRWRRRSTSISSLSRSPEAEYHPFYRRIRCSPSTESGTRSRSRVPKSEPS